MASKPAVAISTPASAGPPSADGVADGAVERAGGGQLAPLDQPRHERVQRRAQDRHEARQQRGGDVEQPQLRVGQQRVDASAPPSRPASRARRSIISRRRSNASASAPPSSASARIGDELRRADEPDRDRAPREVVHLHRDRDERDRRAEQRDALADHQQPQLAPAPQQVGVDRHRPQRPPEGSTPQAYTTLDRLTGSDPVEAGRGFRRDGRPRRRRGRAPRSRAPGRPRRRGRAAARRPRGPRAAKSSSSSAYGLAALDRRPSSGSASGRRSRSVGRAAVPRVGGDDRARLPHDLERRRGTARRRRSRTCRARRRRSAAAPARRASTPSPPVDQLGRDALGLARQQPQRAHAVAADVHQRPALELARPAHVGRGRVEREAERRAHDAQPRRSRPSRTSDDEPRRSAGGSAT